MTCNVGTTANVADLWAAYATDRSTENRNALVTQFMPVVYRNAVSMRKRMPKIDLADLISGGSFGLMRAVETFDPTCGVNFPGYCAHRVRGAMLDEVRRMDWVPRPVRLQARRIASIEAAIFAATGRMPTDAELSERLGGPVREQRPVVVGGGEALEERQGSTVDPSARLQSLDFLQAIGKGLTSDEAEMIRLYYWESLPMAEIGRRLNLCESRISQMHSKLLSRPRFAKHVRAVASGEFIPALESDP